MYSYLVCALVHDTHNLLTLSVHAQWGFVCVCACVSITLLCYLLLHAMQHSKKGTNRFSMKVRYFKKAIFAKVTLLKSYGIFFLKYMLDATAILLLSICSCALSIYSCDTVTLLHCTKIVISYNRSYSYTARVVLWKGFSY